MATIISLAPFRCAIHCAPPGMMSCFIVDLYVVYVCSFVCCWYFGVSFVSLSFACPHTLPFLLSFSCSIHIRLNVIYCSCAGRHGTPAGAKIESGLIYPRLMVLTFPVCFHLAYRVEGGRRPPTYSFLKSVFFMFYVSLCR